MQMIKRKQIFHNPLRAHDPNNPNPEVEKKVSSLNKNQKNPSIQVQDDQYNYDDTNNYYQNENDRVQSRGRRPYRGQNTGQLVTII